MCSIFIYGQANSFCADLPYGYLELYGISVLTLSDVSTHSYHTYEDLQNASLPYDAVIVGSDQVWNPVTTGDNLKVYGLGFLPVGVK